MTPAAGKPTPAAESEASEYTVVARRYRPRRFEEVVGQDHVVQALRNAIRLERVTHAYLFSGTRGVGKTSIARIFAKCLNCVEGPTETPCLECDICRAIAGGQDVDVIEIDGASNNGVEAVRELRQNAGLRPSRARYKIYYIDEVHMLSTGAFNALLKTLEEPPEHVKFFFATTEPNKIPITVLSRCQRYDFSGISPEQTVATLASICEREGVAADPDALRAVARRASGSMRDAQSLLEQLLSFGGERLTVELVNRQLGIAGDDRVLDLLEALVKHDPGRALSLHDAAVAGGVQPSEVLGGLLEFVRDAMVLAAGAEIDLLAATGRNRTRLQAIVEVWPLDSILAAQQILAETRGRLRGSPHGRLLVELALVRVARLENLTDLSELVGRLATLEQGLPAPSASGTAAASSAAEKKKPTPERVIAEEPSATEAVEPSPPKPVVAPSAEIAAEPATTALPASRGDEPKTETRTPWDLLAIQSAWLGWTEEFEETLARRLARLTPQALEEPNRLVLVPDPAYAWSIDTLDTTENRSKIEGRVGRRLGRAVEVRFEVPAETREDAARAGSQAKHEERLNDDPVVRKVIDLFEARPVRVELEDDRLP
ncbi:MAG: DNA polymerase III subunit gamma/tau [Isosphaeraceae bacterium]|nr:DNA polymerase III subunit gamma/tau [Isosphaeraceae bacterium]